MEELCVALPFLPRLNLFNTQVGRVHFYIALGVVVSAPKPLVAHFAHLDFLIILRPESTGRMTKEKTNDVYFVIQDIYVITIAKDLGEQVHT